MKPTYSANIYLRSFSWGAGAVQPVYQVMPLGKDYDSHLDAVNAAMAETTMHPTAIGFVIKPGRRPPDPADLFWPPPKIKS
jgi:hypothetical protein